MKLAEQHIYGSTRLGVYYPDTTLLQRDIAISGFNSTGAYIPSSDVDSTVLSIDTANFSHLLAHKQYELTDHLGDVLASISDRHTPIYTSSIQGYSADIVNANLYYPFGQIMTKYTGDTSYRDRFGFNGQEKDDEVNGDGNAYTAENWEYNPTLGRRFNIDPIIRPFESPYAVIANCPIYFIDPNGADPTPNGQKIEQNAIYPTPDTKPLPVMLSEVLVSAKRLEKINTPEFFTHSDNSFYRALIGMKAWDESLMLKENSKSSPPNYYQNGGAMIGTNAPNASNFKQGVMGVGWPSYIIPIEAIQARTAIFGMVANGNNSTPEKPGETEVTDAYIEAYNEKEVKKSVEATTNNTMGLPVITDFKSENILFERMIIRKGDTVYLRIKFGVYSDGLKKENYQDELKLHKKSIK